MESETEEPRQSAAAVMSTLATAVVVTLSMICQSSSSDSSNGGPADADADADAVLDAIGVKAEERYIIVKQYESNHKISQRKVIESQKIIFRIAITVESGIGSRVLTRLSNCL